MDMDIIKVDKRALSVKPKKLRREGWVPGVVFGKSLEESIPVQMKEQEARKLIREKREGSKIELEIEGDRYPVQIKEKVCSMLTNEIEHISFQALKRGERVNSVIHIVLVNDDKISGILERMLLEIPYSSLPREMIDTITIDLDGVKPGTVVMVRDIPELMSDKLELKVDPESIVYRINERRHATAAAESGEAETEV